MIIMPMLFQYRNIRHFLGMNITKQAKQEIHVIAQEGNDGAAPPNTHTHTLNFPAPLGGLPYLSGLLDCT